MQDEAADNEEQPADPLSRLPIELFLMILEWLPMKDLLILMRTSKYWEDGCRDTLHK